MRGREMCSEGKGETGDSPDRETHWAFVYNSLAETTFCHRQNRPSPRLWNIYLRIEVGLAPPSSNCVFKPGPRAMKGGSKFSDVNQPAFTIPWAIHRSWNCTRKRPNTCALSLLESPAFSVQYRGQRRLASPLFLLEYRVAL